MVPACSECKFENWRGARQNDNLLHGADMNNPLAFCSNGTIPHQNVVDGPREEELKIVKHVHPCCLISSA